MNQEEIREKYRKIGIKQLKWAVAEEKLQSKCTHPDVLIKHRGDTGNYDRTADCYWIEYKCPDCGKQWSVDQ